ncbi:hypothetical protein [Methanococcoides sp. FTZ1]|uniref:hypothetical protein n=1 Tax=Methanococcoides sp. FTZ1 TaxID=3439061 RepID=UPI003F84D0D6
MAKKESLNAFIYNSFSIFVDIKNNKLNVKNIIQYSKTKYNLMMKTNFVYKFTATMPQVQHGRT